MKDVYLNGGDALKNYFEIVFDGLPDFIEHPTLPENKVLLRAKSVEIPEVGLQTADIDFYTTKIKVPVAKFELEKLLTVVFRIDENWTVYKQLIKWRNSIASLDTNVFYFYSPAFIMGWATNRCDSITVRALKKGSTEPVMVWQFKEAIPIKISGVDFSYESADPQTVSVTFMFHEMNENPG